MGLFDVNPIPNCHISPFMSRPKPNSDPKWVILDLSWPEGVLVNDGVDKHGYMGSDFSLTFPSIDHLTLELTKLGWGAHIYKIDVSRIFRHLKMDPFDYDLFRSALKRYIHSHMFAVQDKTWQSFLPRGQ